jgi:AraC-like DNA-binding protein
MSSTRQLGTSGSFARSSSGAEPNIETESLQKWRLKKVLAYIDENLAESVSLADLARTAGLSRMYFAARFRAATGQRPHDYVLQRRIERAKEMLAQTEETLVNIALDIGFHTQAHFTTVFKKFVGSTPGRWRAINRFA